MANRFTGAYDISIQLAPDGADALLAAVHAKGHALPGAPGPHLLHGLALNLPLAGSTSSQHLRGSLQVQISTPSLRVASGAPGRVTVSVEVYAWFRAAQGVAPAPEFVHGTLRFTTGVAVRECIGTALAEVQVGAGTTEVAFTPAPGAPLTGPHRQLVEDVVRELLASAFGPVQYRVGSLGDGDFIVRHVGFRTLGSGASSAFVLLLGFGEGGAPDPNSFSEMFLGTQDDVALALGREFFSARLSEAVRAKLVGIQVSGSRLGVDFTAAPDPDSLRVELLQDGLIATIDGAGSLSPGGSFRFRLRVAFGVLVSGGNLFLALATEPQLEITQGNALLHVVFWLFRGRIRNRIEIAAGGAVSVANAQLDALIDGSIRELMEELGTPGVTLRLQRARVDPDGVVLGGRFHLGPARPVVASFVTTTQAGATTFLQATKYSALKSWIPGGTIAGYTWLQQRADGAITSQVDEPHRFVLRPEPEVGIAYGEHYGWPPSVWCLQVHGTQSRGSLGTMPAAGAVCGVAVVMPTVDLTLLDGLLTIEVADGAGGVAADLAPWARFRSHALARDEERRGVLLVHRWDGRSRDVIQALSELARELPLFVTLVVEERERSGADARELSAFALSSDPTGAWRKRFALERAGASVLVGEAGRILWRDEGPLRAEELKRVLTGLKLDGARPPRRAALQLALFPGSFAPLLHFECLPVLTTTESFVLSTKKLHGREHELVFWTSWSQASLEELRRRAKAGERDAPYTILVNDGEQPELARRTLEQHGLASEHVAFDPERRIARRYGISCWPTAVRIDADGRIAAARFGLEHAHAKDPVQQAGA